MSGSRAGRRRDGGDFEILVSWPLEAGLGGTFAAIRQTRTRFHCVFFQSTPSINANLCEAYRSTFVWPHPYSARTFSPPKTIPQRLREDVIICSLGSNGLRRLRTNIPSLRVGSVDQTLFYDGDLEIPRRGKELAVPRDVTFHVFESNQRLVRLPEELKERFSRRDPPVHPSRLLSSSREPAPQPIVLKPLRIIVKVKRDGLRTGPGVGDSH